MHADQDASFRFINDTMLSIEQRLYEFEKQPRENRQTGQSLEVLQKQFSRMSISEQDVKKQQMVLRSLTFHSRPVRHDSIKPAHQQTFAWALQTTSMDDPKIGATKPGLKLGNWLKAGHGIFWISGKPGSGKSTLMKFVANDDRTLKLLSQWSSPGKAIIASHYFWNAGTVIQKSHEGLLRGLLYEILCLRPNLIPIGCPDRWSQTETYAEWPISYLHESLSRVFSAAALDDISFCFFIDGLDEFDGDHLQLCQILKDLAAFKNVKLCLSSRPWNVFDDAFGNGPLKLYVHDLTKDDIRNFSRSSLQEHPRWNSINVGGQGEWLISEISEKAWGVFLWAFLVTKLLRNGLTNRDRFSDLKRRLLSFPKELETFFEEILGSIEPFYRSKMATTLQIAVAAQEPLDYIIYDWHDKEYDDENYAMQLPMSPLNASEMSAIRECTVFRLESRTRGLLELPEGQTQVTFLHRTVKDFLNTKKVADSLTRVIIPNFKFCSRKSILKADLACLKSLTDTELDIPEMMPQGRTTNEQMRWNHTEAWIEGSNLSRLVDQFMSHAAAIDAEAFPGDDQDLDTMLDEVDSVLSKRVTNFEHESYFRTELVEFGVFNFLRRKLDGDPHFVPTHDHRIVSRLILPTTPLADDYTHLHKLGSQIFSTLLESGQLVANRFDNNSLTVWSALLGCLNSGGSALLIELLENGTIPSIIKQDPDPGAMAENCSKVAWGLYLGFAFEIPSNPAVERLYLGTLGHLLKAEFSLAPTALSVHNCIYHNFINPLARVSPAKKAQNKIFLLMKVADLLLELVTRLKMTQFIGFIEDSVSSLKDRYAITQRTDAKRLRKADLETDVDNDQESEDGWPRPTKMIRRA